MVLIIRFLSGAFVERGQDPHADLLIVQDITMSVVLVVTDATAINVYLKRWRASGSVRVRVMSSSRVYRHVV